MVERSKDMAGAGKASPRFFIIIFPKNIRACCPRSVRQYHTKRLPLPCLRDGRCAPFPSFITVHSNNHQEIHINHTFFFEGSIINNPRVMTGKVIGFDRPPTTDKNFFSFSFLFIYSSLSSNF